MEGPIRIQGFSTDSVPRTKNRFESWNRVHTHIKRVVTPHFSGQLSLDPVPDGWVPLRI